MTSDQVAALLFTGKAALRKAQQRLRRLVDTGRLDRCRHYAGFCYYAAERPDQLDHRLNLNWAELWFRGKLRSWETFEQWELEPRFAMLRADALAAVANRFTGKLNCWFVELDQATNPWEKAARYCDLYESGGYLGAWWAGKAECFPGILCVAPTEQRFAVIRHDVARFNRSGLRFEVRLLDELIEEARQCSRR